MKKTGAVLFFLSVCCAFADPDRDWPSVVVTPVLDVPMRDAAITRGPDPAGSGTGGVYYLTGTLAVRPGGHLRPPDLMSSRPLENGDTARDPDFDNGRAIKLWKSDDLKTWEDLGVVWDMKEDVFGPKGDARHETIEWQRMTRYDFGPEGDEINLGIVEPELHFVKGGWYICFSVNRRGTGLIKSLSGRPEGPYTGWAPITLEGGSPSMFEDSDGSVYWLIDGGWIAKMTDDLQGLAETPRPIRPAHDAPPDWAVEKKGVPVFRDHPRMVGDHGAFLFKNRGRYYLTAAEWTHRLGEPCDDTYIAYADRLEGPWSRRHLMVPHGGGITVFQGPRSSAVPKYYYPQQAFYLESVSKNARPLDEVERAKNDDTWYAAFSGNDGRARCRDRATFTPLEWAGPERHIPLLWDDCESVPRKPRHVFTERGPWPYMKPLIAGIKMRDMIVRKMPDGYLYLSGSIYGKPKELFVYRSKNMLDWEEVGPLWTYDRIEWLEEKLPLPELKPGRIPWQHTFWDVRLLHWNNTYYLAFDIFCNDEHPEHRGCGALKSVSGRVEGPYVSLGKVGGQLGKDPGPIMPGFLAWRGRLYASNWIDWKRVAAEADPEVPGWKWDYRPVDGGAFKHMPRMDPFGMEVVDGKIIFKTAGNGPKGWVQDASYDVNYVTAASPWGPVVSDRMRTVPHAAAANFFQDFEGDWWRVFFGSDATAAWHDQTCFLPLRVEHVGNELLIDVVNDGDLDERRLKIIGGGEIAEVKTVMETLE